MSQFHDTELQQNVTVDKSIDKELVPNGKQNENWLARMRFGTRNKNVARAGVLSVAAIGILAMTTSSLLSKRADLAPEFPIVIRAQSRSVNSGGAVLAVDPSGSLYERKTAPPPHKSFWSRPLWNSSRDFIALTVAGRTETTN